MLCQSVKVILVADELNLLEPSLNKGDVLPDSLVSDKKLAGLLLDDTRDDVDVVRHRMLAPVLAAQALRTKADALGILVNLILHNWEIGGVLSLELGERPLLVETLIVAGKEVFTRHFLDGHVVFADRLAL